jgi:hypothetical protein
MPLDPTYGRRIDKLKLILLSFSVFFRLNPFKSVLKSQGFRSQDVRIHAVIITIAATHAPTPSHWLMEIFCFCRKNASNTVTAG